MKKIIYITVTVLLFIGCCSASQRQPAATIQQPSVKIDCVDSLAVEYKDRGNLKADNGNKQGAIADYTKAIEISPHYVIAYSNRGIVKSSIGDKQGAIDDYTKTLELDPLKVSTYFNRANAKVSLGDEEGAIEDYTKATEIDPNYAKAYYGRGNVKGQNLSDFRGAIKDYNKAIEIDSLYANAYSNRAANRFLVGDSVGTVSDYKKFMILSKELKDVEQIVRASNNLGRTLYDLERFEESAEAYSEGILASPEDGKLYYGRGLSLYQIGDKKGACKDWHKSSALDCFEANLLLPLCDDIDK